MSPEERLTAMDNKLNTVLQLLQERAEKKTPNLRIIDFAALAGKSRWTIMRDIRDGKIKKVNGRIPRDQLSKYTS
jgi:hypothetical protein